MIRFSPSLIRSGQSKIIFLVLKKKLIIFERERGGGQKGRQRIPSRVCANSAEIKSWMLNQLSHPDTPKVISLLVNSKLLDEGP